LDEQGSAAQAGLGEKDIITKVNGKQVNTTSELLELIGRSKVGETVTLTTLRDGSTKDVAVRLKARPDEGQ
jgi:S1-C subfamily serine protease